MNNLRLVSIFILGLITLVSQLVYYKLTTPLSQAEPFSAAEDGDADMSLRLKDYSDTYISKVRVDLTSPEQQVQLEWSGPHAAEQDTGPFHSSPGIGVGCDCNDFEDSRREDTNCTPKGEWKVAGFNDFLPTVPYCLHVTWFHIPRQIALHSHPEVPEHPASHGCVRLEHYPAQLIHNNAIAGKTRVIVDGTWTPPPIAASLESDSQIP